LFLVTVSLTVGAVYFNYRLPVKVNSVLRQEIDVQREEQSHQQRFVNRMKEAKVYLDSLGKPGVNIGLADMQLTSKMTDLLNLQQKDSSLYGQMNQVIVGTFLELQASKKQLVSLGNSQQEISDLKAELSRVNGELIITKGQLDALRQGLEAQ
jgi:hypothetical protein